MLGKLSLYVSMSRTEGGSQASGGAELYAELQSLESNPAEPSPSPTLILAAGGWFGKGVMLLVRMLEYFDAA